LEYFILSKYELVKMKEHILFYFCRKGQIKRTFILYYTGIWDIYYIIVLSIGNLFMKILTKVFFHSRE